MNRRARRRPKSGSNVRPAESLERRFLFASVSIDTASSPITKITIEDTGEFQFNTNQVFEQVAGTGQVYQTGGDKPYSAFFLRTDDDGKLYGNQVVLGFATSFVPTGTQSRRTETDGTEVIVSTFEPSDGAPFLITQEVTYTPGQSFFSVNNTIQNAGNQPLAFSLFAYADVNPRGRGVYDDTLGAVASIDADGQPTIVIDPLDGATVADFHQADEFFTITDQIGTPGSTLDFTAANPQPPGTEQVDTGIALQWFGESIAAGGSALYAFRGGIQPVDGAPTPAATPHARSRASAPSARSTRRRETSSSFTTTPPAAAASTRPPSARTTSSSTAPASPRPTASPPR
jgi:hypothetical protein